MTRAQRLINLQILILVRSLQSSNIDVGEYLDRRLFFKCRLSTTVNLRVHTVVVKSIPVQRAGAEDVAGWLL